MLKHLSTLLFTTLIPIISLAIFKGPGGGGENKDSTATFEEEFMHFGKERVTLPRLRKIRDSLHSLEEPPEDLLEKVDFYLGLEKKSEEELTLMIDSLLELDSLPVPEIQKVQVYIQKLDEKEKKPGEFLMVPYDDTPYPANHFYGKWDARKVNPYRRGTPEKDTTLKLCLKSDSLNCGYHPPIEGKITSYYGMRHGKQHKGIDIDLQVWDEVKAAFPGMVRMAKYYGGYGRVVIIRHYNGLETLYAHLHRFKVEPGDIVEAGDVIGLGGSSGHSTGSHLHFETRFQGIPINPSHLISFEKNRLLGDTLVLSPHRRKFAAYPQGTKFHEVEYGEYLYQIAEHYGVSIRRICELNGIQRNTILKVGQKLRISI